jgi:hypothetical protein
VEVEFMKHFRFLSAFAALAMTSGAAMAHAIVLGSTPRADANLKGDETPIEIRFNSRIDAGRSYLKLFKIDGDAVTLPLADSTSEDTLKAKASGLTPGHYRLHWQTLSPDGHISQGDIPFDVSR